MHLIRRAVALLPSDAERYTSQNYMREEPHDRQITESATPRCMEA